MEKINVVGLGPGNQLFITKQGIELIESSQVIVGDSRQIESVRELLKDQEIYIVKKFPELISYLKEVKKEITILVSGDTGFYSLLDYLKRNLEGIEIQVTPGISSFQYLFAKLKETWHDYLLISLHGRECDYVEILKLSNKGVIFLTDKNNSPREVAKKLTQLGMGNLDIIVGENLSYPDEKIHFFKAENYENIEDFSLNVMVVKK